MGVVVAYLKASLLSRPLYGWIKHHHQLKGLGFLACSDFLFRRNDFSISLGVDPYLFFLYGGNRISSEEFNRMPFLRYVRSSFAGIRYRIKENNENIQKTGV
jgi:hypothetical protein